MPRFRNPVVSTANITDGSITTDKLADGAVTEPKVGAGAVTEAKLDALAVTAAKLADSAVTATKIANLAVGTAAIANAAITSAKIANLAVDTAQIANAAITNAKIANLAVDTAQIANAAITNAKIANLSASKITAGTITAQTISLNGGAIQTANFDSDPLNGIGWRIKGDGSAEFFSGVDVVGLFSYGSIVTDFVFKAINTTAFQPTYTWQGDEDTGMFHTNTNQVQFSAGGTESFRVFSSGIRVVQDGGGAGSPTLRFGVSEQGLGLYRLAANYLGLAAGGSLNVQFGPNDISLPGAGTTSNSGLPAYRSGAATTTSIHRLVSSERFKKYVGPLSAADEQRHLEVVHGHRLSRWQERGRRGGPWLFGITAEDAYEVQPDAVALDEEGAPLSFDPGNALAIPLLVAYRHLEARVAALEAA